MSFPGRLKPTYNALRSALLESRIRLPRAQSATRTGKAENYPSKPLSIVLSPYLASSTPFPLLSSHRYPPSSSPLSSLTVPSSSLSRSLALFASSSSSPSSLSPHTRALSRPSSGYHRFRVCTWARRSIFQAVAHEKRSSWGRVPHCHGRRR